MLNRIYSNNFEDTHYPLKNPGTGFPNDLLTHISILVADHNTELAVYYIGVDSDTITVEIAKYIGDARNRTLEPYAGCVYDKSNHRVANLVSAHTGGNIGFVCFGSGIEVSGTYLGPADIDPACYVFDVNDNVSYINGRGVHTPEVLNITTSGVLKHDVVEDTCRLSFDHSIDGFLLDGRDRYKFGCISTVNGYPVTDHTLHIAIPDGFTIELDNLKSDNIRDPYRDNPIDRMIITIKAADTYDGRYGCPDNDPILNILYAPLHSNSSSDTPMDKPLDRYISLYRDWRLSSGTREEDTVIVNNIQTYTHSDGDEYIYNEPITQTDAISVTMPNEGSVVLLKTDTGMWEE